MADIKFSEFPKATISKDSDEIAILQDGVNKMIPSPVLESKIINKTVSRVIDQGGASLNVINLKGIVPTYADLALITPTPELNDAYQVEADGLVYVYTDNGFQADGEGFYLLPEPNGVVEEGNTQAVSGGEVFDVIEPIKDQLEFQSNFLPEINVDLAVGKKIEGERIAPNGDILTNLSSFCRTGKLPIIWGKIEVTARMSSNGYIAIYNKDESLSRTIDPGALGIKTLNIDINENEYYIDVSFAPSGGSQSATVIQTEINSDFQFLSNRDVINIVEDFYSNKLNLNSPTNGISLISGTFGSDSSVYKINIGVSTFQLAVDFKINVDMNTAPNTPTIFRIEGENSNIDIQLDIKQPQPLFSAFQSDNPTYQQQLQYNSGIRMNNVSYPMRTLHERPLVGEDAFGIWLKGDYNIDELPLVADLNSRSSFLDTNQDLAILFENDKISLIHDGIGVDNTPFGSVSTVFELSIKDSLDNYKPLRVLYEELKSLGLIHDFDIQFYDLSYSKTTEDLLQFGKIKLVGLYGIQQDPLVSTTSYNYDSFPANFPLKIDDKKHTIEMLKSGSKIYISFDGFVKEYDMEGDVLNVYLGGLTTNGGARFYNLELNRNSWGESEKLFSSSSTTNPNIGVHIIASKRSPYILGLMGHGTVQTYEGSGVITNTQDQSLTRVEDVILKLRDKGYSLVSMDEFVRMYSGVIPMPKRVAFLIYDDYRIADSYQNLRNRSFLSKYGATINFANINASYPDTPENQKLFQSMRGNGFTNMTHSFTHDVVLPRKQSLVIQYQLKQTLIDCDLKNWIHNVIVYPGRGQWENTYQMLRDNGYMLAFSNVGGFSTMITNPYDMHRLNFADNGAYNVFNAII